MQASPSAQSLGSVRGRYERRLLKSTFKTQANALLRKNGTQQKRAWASNLVILCMPILFCLLLFALEKVVNNAFNKPDNKCGCECFTCKGPNGQTITATAADPRACVGRECLDDPPSTNCGFEWSDSGQAAFCAIPTPSTWPALMQVPRISTDEQTVALHTGANSDAIVRGLFFTPSIDQDNAVRANESFTANSAPPNSSYMSALSQLGLVYGTQQRGRDFYSLYLEPAFVSTGTYNATLLNLVNDTAASEAALAPFVGLIDEVDLGLYGLGDPETMQATLQRAADASEINTLTYCGYQQASPDRCPPGSAGQTPILQAWDFQSTNASALAVRMWYNATARGREGPPTILRINQGINRATNAFLQWALGDQSYQTWLLGVQEMPKGGSELRLDFSNLLGPLFFCWLLQLLLPLQLYQLVYEKERGLRRMMKMHGLGDWAYWAIQYCWFFVVTYLFTWILIIFGSGIGLSFFRRTDYSFQAVFYLLWTNCMIAFAFLLSSLFRSSKTAVTVGFLYVLGSGLVGYLLVQQFVSQEYWWVIFLELVPGWALFRGLYEVAQYAFRASMQDTEGITWSSLGDDNNGLPAVMIIFAVEWVVFMLAAWYLEQVLDTGVGVPRHPLFFLGRLRGGGKTRKAGGGGAGADDVVEVAVEPEDVRAERLRVEALQAGDAGEAIVIRDLHKTFPAAGGAGEKHAVRGLTLAIERGECFGLLGPNGAGKSTTLGVLTGFLQPTSGTAVIEGHDIRRDMPTIYSLMGVCPQDNLLWDRLTAREHLLFYGRLKNLAGEELRAAVDAALQSVNLFHGGVGDKQVRKYSGGMRRRLSVAVSFIGDPLVVYLDEPSTGLDPASRQNLWGVVKEAKRDRGIILTTHSMEEAAVLCDRLGIFVDGTLVCIGSPKELTARHGDFYAFTISTPPDQEAEADALVRGLAPGARCTYALAGTRKYELPVGEVTLPAVFEAMAAAKQRITVLDWGIANVTLEEVFVKFARGLGLEAGLH